MSNSAFALCAIALGITIVTSQAQPASAAPSTATPKELPPASTKVGLTFDKDIKPLFEASCIKCHGAQKPKGNLRLDTLEGFKAGSEDGAIYKEGDSANSAIVKAIARINPKTMMPPAPRKPRPGPDGQMPPQQEPPKPLTPEQVGLVRAWIDQGAK
jgi:hypothetical protein